MLSPNRFLESVHTAFCISFMYAYLIAGFANFLGFIAVDRYVPTSALAKTTDSIETSPRTSVAVQECRCK